MAGFAACTSNRPSRINRNREPEIPQLAAATDVPVPVSIWIRRGRSENTVMAAAHYDAAKQQGRHEKDWIRSLLP